MSVNLFDANFYSAANPDLAAAGLTTDAQLRSHFQSSGIDEGRLFSPLANLNLYSSSNPDLAAAGLNTNRQVFNHLQNNGVAEGRRFSQFVDINFYLAANPDVNQIFEGSRERALEHLQTNGVAEGRIFSPFIGVVNEPGEGEGLNYYLLANPDVNQAFGGDKTLALQHLELSGVAEGRSFSPFVDLGYYLSNNSDLNRAFGDNRAQALEHLAGFGLDEGRRFSPAFDVNFYRNSNLDLRDADLTTNRQLFEQWVNSGAITEERTGTSDPGNTLNTALDLGSPALGATLFNDFVGSNDSNDYYRFTLNDSRNISVGFFDPYGGSGLLNADLDLGLIDANGNVIESSTAGSSTADSINFLGLQPGSYFIRVYQGSSDASSNYSLGIGVFPSEEPGNSIDTAYSLVDKTVNIDPPFSSVIRDSVGDNSDSSDYYKLDLYSDASFSASLDPFSADADLFLLDSDGNTIDSSELSGTDIDSINSIPLTAGTYFVQISGLGSSTDYRLQLNAV